MPNEHLLPDSSQPGLTEHSVFNLSESILFHNLPEVRSVFETLTPRGLSIVRKNLGPTGEYEVVKLLGDLDLVIWDLDETIVQGTGEEVHDGPYARFSYAARTALEEQGVFLGDHEWVLLWDGNKEQGMIGFRSFTGVAQRDVCVGIARALTEHFRASQIQINPDRINALSDQFLVDQYKVYRDKIKLNDGIESTFTALRAGGIKLGLCTSSGDSFVQVLRGDHAKFHVLQYFDFVQHGAEKKIRDGEFRGDAVRNVFNGLGVDPSRCCMIGDSISDYASAALAGIPMVILRFPDLTHEASLKRFLKHLDAAHATHGNLVAQTSLVIVDSYDQIRIGGRGGSLRWEVGPREQLEY